MNTRATCPNHPDEPALGYLAACDDAAQRLKRRERQLRCGRCGLWIWEEFLVDRAGAMTQHQFNRQPKEHRA